MGKFDASIPRKMFWSKDTGGPRSCPECHGELENDYQSYLLLVRIHGDDQPFIVGNTDGYFCAQCPVVVLDHQAFAECAMTSSSTSSSLNFSVAGIVALDAIPEEKAHLPLGEDDNPIPLVRFTNVLGSGPLRKRRRRKKVKQRHRKRM